MQLEQYYLGCLAHASYLMTDERTKTAAVVDPQRDIDQYIADAAADGWKIQHVFLTHFHTDFLAGHIELLDKTDTLIYLGANAEAEYDFTPVKEGDVVEFGDVRLKIPETPGHTPEGISILVFDVRHSDTHSHTVRTGDTLFIGDVGRSERPSLDANMQKSIKPLALDDVLRLQSEGMQLVDIRDGANFEGAHLQGVPSIPLDGIYATWCGSLLNHNAPIVVIADIGDQGEAVVRLGRIGFVNVASYLRDGTRALESRSELIEVTSGITAPTLGERLQSDIPSVVLDVRLPQERENVGFIEGSLNIPLMHLEERIAEVPTDRPLIAQYAGGYRSVIPCGILQRNGINCMEMVGGFKAWLVSKQPFVESAVTM